MEITQHTLTDMRFIEVTGIIAKTKGARLAREMGLLDDDGLTEIGKRVLHRVDSGEIKPRNPYEPTKVYEV